MFCAFILTAKHRFRSNFSPSQKINDPFCCCGRPPDRIIACILFLRIGLHLDLVLKLSKLLKGILPAIGYNSGQLGQVEIIPFLRSITWVISNSNAELLTLTSVSVVIMCHMMFGNGKGICKPPRVMLATTATLRNSSSDWANAIHSGDHFQPLGRTVGLPHQCAH